MSIHQPKFHLHIPSWKSIASILEEAFDGWIEDNVPRLSAALTFYTLLSLAPLLVVMIATAAFVYGEDAGARTTDLADPRFGGARGRR